MLRTGIRMVALLATVLSAWSLNLRWGPGAGPAGPPMQWERPVVGATLLAAVVLACALLARHGRPVHLALRAIAALAAAGALLIVIQLRRDAARGFVGLVEGTGWRGLAIGAGLAVLAALALQWPARRTDPIR